jgi:5-methylcytosine-specific restriction protein B
MTQRAVQSVFFWPADMATPFRAVYGRVKGSNKYSKDFHQIATPAARAMERAFGLPERGQTSLVWVWPGGQRAENSQFKPGAVDDSRSRAHWPYGDSPDPWRLSQNVGPDTLESITGEPGEPRVQMEPEAEAAGEAQLQRVQSADERPWYVAVHLHGDDAVLHVRTVLENPKPGHEFASWERLPAAIRREMGVTRRRGEATGFVEFEEGVPVRAGAIVKQVLDAFKDNPNVLLVGPPGCGKTVAMEDLRRAYEEGTASVMFDPDVNHGAFSEVGNTFDGETRVRSLVFHPSYAYEDFVIGLLPEPVRDADGRPAGGVTVRPRVGPLLELAVFASEEKRRALLICDEFNRGAAAAIFGDTLALLDSDKRRTPGQEDGATVDTPYFHLAPETSAGEPLPALTSLPSSLHILAAMNSADRSVAPLDAALRRRFAIVYVGPDYAVLRDRLEVPVDFELGDPSGWNTPEHAKALAVEVLLALNERIEVVLGRDFLLGHSVMWDVAGDTYETALRSLAVAMDNRVMGTLALSFVDNDAALAAVLNVPGSEREASGRRAAVWHQPSASVQQVAAPRLRFERFQSLDDGALTSVLASLLN